MKINVKEQKGSALVWVLVITVIFGILGMAIGWVALSMNKRSVNNFELTQSYFTVRSAVDSVLENLNHYDTSFSGSIKTEQEYNTEITKYNNALSGYLYKNLVNGNKSVNFQNFFNLNSMDEEIQTASNQMAGCALTGGISKGHVVLTAEAGEENTTADAITLEAYRKPENVVWPSKEWAVKMPIGTLNTSNNGSNRLVLGAKDGVNVGGSLTLDEQSQWDQLDVAVYKVTTETTTTGNSAGTVVGKLCITKDQNMEKKAIFIYIENGATLKLYGMDVGYAAQNTTATPNTNRGELKWFGEGKEDWSQYYGPDIFIYVEPGGTLSFERTNTIPVNGKNELVPYSIYVCGKSETGKAATVTATKAADDSTGSNGIRPDGVEVYYCQDVTVNTIANWSGNSWIYYKDSNGSKKYISSTSTPGRIPLSGYKQAGTPYQYLSETEQAKDPSGGLMGDLWSVFKYSKGTEAK